ncbi:uncharacterized protein LOC131045281 [Cryptomeria japonica]|uniref:uncharacterized protein LOC131045281 n=1 Tax=Cryptomeria japonica TaxID=3369 RepID=UPI0025ACBE0C|nr:uncharacterized protein LOC131045281 [Cryptomeria japonica]
MANQASRWALRLVLLVLICVVAFYVGRPLYWKLSATLQEVREKNYDAKAVRDGITQLMYSAQKSVGWFNDESDAGVNEKSTKKLAKKVDKTKKANSRRLAYL